MRLFSKDFVDIALNTDAYVGKTKEHYLVFKVTVSDTKSFLPLITISDFHLIIGIS